MGKRNIKYKQSTKSMCNILSYNTLQTYWSIKGRG